MKVTDLLLFQNNRMDKNFRNHVLHLTALNDSVLISANDILKLLASSNIYSMQQRKVAKKRYTPSHYDCEVYKR